MVFDAKKANEDFKRLCYIKDNPYSCNKKLLNGEKCYTRFKSPQTLERHQHSKYHIREFNRKICKPKIKKKPREIGKVIIKYDDLHITCQTCGRKFAHPSNRDRHERIFHTREYKYICKYKSCGKKFIRNDAWKNHLIDIHKDFNIYNCPIDGCDKWFQMRVQVTNHKKEAHREIYSK